MPYLEAFPTPAAHQTLGAVVEEANDQRRTKEQTAQERGRASGDAMETWPTELQTQIMSRSNAQVRIDPCAEAGGGLLNNSDIPEEVAV